MHTLEEHLRQLESLLGEVVIKYTSLAGHGLVLNASKSVVREVAEASV